MNEKTNKIVLKGEKLSSLISSSAYPTSGYPHYFREKNNSISIYDIEVDNKLNIKTVGHLTSLFFSNCHFKDDVIVEIEFHEVELIFHECTFEMSCLFNKSKNSSIKFDSCQA